MMMMMIYPLASSASFAEGWVCDGRERAMKSDVGGVMRDTRARWRATVMGARCAVENID